MISRTYKLRFTHEYDSARHTYKLDSLTPMISRRTYKLNSFTPTISRRTYKLNSLAPTSPK